MLLSSVLFAVEYSELGLGIVIVIALAVALLIPYLTKEIRRGKVELGPQEPIGAGDIHPGRINNPAPGQPDAQADPYDPEARR